MTEPAEPTLLEEQPGTNSKPKRRTPAAKPRAASAKPRAKAAKADAPTAKSVVAAEEVAPATTSKTATATPARSRKAPSRKPAAAPVEEAAETMLPGMEATTRSPRRGKSAKARTVPTPGTGRVEEWSPSRAQSERPAKKEVEPATPPSPAAAAPAANGAATGPAPALEAPAMEPAMRKYPVYIPRHVAKQMEEQGQTAPIAVSPDAIPEAARAAVEAARAVQAERAAQHAQRMAARLEARGERGERPERPERQERAERPDRPDRPDRAERHDQSELVAPTADVDEDLGTAEGIVEISGKGFGFIRDAKRGFAQHPSDVFVTPETVRRFNLRDGQWIKGEIRLGGRGAQLHRLTEINGDDPEKSKILPAFDELTVISPMERIVMETTPDRNTTRLIDLFTPIGKGQRGLIVAPPRTGKTTLLQHIADAVVKKHPDIKLIILLVDERPEEVTDIKRTVPSAEVMASSNDSDVKSHTRIAQLAMERAKRLVEAGKDVFILLDSITRVGRAFNNAMAGGGRTMSGGVDARALEIPRRIFAAARNTEEAGSLTIIATALIETGSRMDDLIFQEFKGTGNMELVLDRKIADQRIYPAIDIFLSGTRREELLIPADDLHKIALIRRGLAGHKPMEAVERLLFFLRKFPTNAQMLREIPG